MSEKEEQMLAAAEVARLEGNEFHKNGDTATAIKSYKRGLAALPKKHKESVNIHKNLGLCYIKQEKWADAIKHCTEAVELAPGDVKALFRRAQAYEKDNNPEKAFEDMVRAMKLEPSNKRFKEAAHRLMKIVSTKRDKKVSTAGISLDVLEAAMKANTPAARIKACTSLAAFSQDTPGAMHLLKNDAVAKLAPLLANVDEHEALHALLHTFSYIASNSWQRACGVLAVLGKAPAEQHLLALVKSKTEKTAKAAVMLISKLLEGCCEEGVDDDFAKAAINKLLQYLIAILPHNEVCSSARDVAISAIVKNANKQDVGKRFVDLGGIRALLIVASCSISALDKDKKPDETSIGISLSKETRMQISVALSYVYDATKTVKGKSKKKTEPYGPFSVDCIKSISWSNDPVTNLPAVQTLTAIIQGVSELGNAILDSEGVMERLMKMAQCNNVHVQCAAAEALSHAATNKDRAKTLLTDGFGILKNLYGKNLPDAVRVRALTGLCKLGSQGGGFQNKQTMADGAVVNLAKKIRPFLTGDDKDLDCQKWASEGLAYLSLDADVKEMVVGDKKILKVINKLCTDGDPTVQFGLANLLVNVCNAFDVAENTEEQEQMKQIGKYAGEYIPEPHKLDGQEYIDRRVKILVNASMCTAMVHLAKSESERAREQVARVFLAMVTDKTHRGRIVQEGGAKALVSLANDNSKAGKLKAAQALAKIAITSNPEIAFPGQRAAELVRPLLMLSKEQKGLLVFEACMALTNLASVSEDLRMRVVRENGIKRLEDIMFDEDWVVRRAAVECLCNMLYCEKVFEMYATKEGAGWERVKLWILFSGCANDDFECARAAAGGLALLSQSPEVCVRITEEKQGMLIMKENAACGNPELQMRALHTLKNMVASGKKTAEIVCGEQGLELLSALHMTLTDERLKGYVTEILEQLCKYGIIKAISDAHRKGMECAQTLENFKRKDEEEDEEEDDEDDDDDDADDIDATATELQAKEDEWDFPVPLSDPTPKIEEVDEAALATQDTLEQEPTNEEKAYNVEKEEATNEGAKVEEAKVEEGKSEQVKGDVVEEQQEEEEEAKTNTDVNATDLAANIEALQSLRDTTETDDTTTTAAATTTTTTSAVPDLSVADLDLD